MNNFRSALKSRKKQQARKEEGPGRQEMRTSGLYWMLTSHNACPLKRIAAPFASCPATRNALLGVSMAILEPNMLTKCLHSDQIRRKGRGSERVLHQTWQRYRSLCTLHNSRTNTCLAQNDESILKTTASAIARLFSCFSSSLPKTSASDRIVWESIRVSCTKVLYI